MNTAEHSVTPEEVMAFLDGELSAADARAMAEHLSHCAECAAVVDQLRGASQALSQWNVPEVPGTVEDLVRARAAGGDGRRGVGLVRSLSRFWNWKMVAMVSGGFAVALLMLSIAVRHANHPEVRNAQVLSSYGYAEFQAAPQAVPPPPSPPPPPPPPRTRFEVKTGRSALSTASTAPLSAKGPIGGLEPSNEPKDQKTMLVMPAPMIARMVSLAVRVKDVDAARVSLDAIVARHRGYAAQLNVSSPEDGVRWVRASLRIPSSELAGAVGDLKGLGRVENESQTGEEVSQQHQDLVARLKTSRETEERFQDILRQRTGNVRDVLEVEQNIAQVRGEIEAMEAEQRALEHRVDFATVEVQLSEEYKAQLVPPADSVSTRMHNAFVAGYHHASETLLGFVLLIEEFGPALVIWGLLLAVPVVFLRRRYRRIRSSM